MTETLERRPELGLKSYDRLFPSQDTVQAGGFGNLIALPLQRRARDYGNSVFVDDNLHAYRDQWEFLASLGRLTPEEVQFSTIWAPGYSSKVIRRLGLCVFPWIGSMPIAQIKAPELLACIRRVESRGKLGTAAHRALQVCGRVFRYAVAVAGPSAQSVG